MFVATNPTPKTANKTNDTINVNELIKKLVIMGYKRTPSTLQTGDFSVRGEIIDIYAINNELPYRIGLFDDDGLYTSFNFSESP